MADEQPRRQPLQRDGQGSEVTSVFHDGKEFVVVDGQEIEVVRSESQIDAPPKFTAEQRRKIGEVYIMVAKLLPMEGRDYTMDFDFPDPDGNPKVSFKAMTRLGMAFVQHLASNLGAQ